MDIAERYSHFDAKYSYDGKFVAFCGKITHEMNPMSIFIESTEQKGSKFLKFCQNSGFNFVPNRHKIVCVGTDNEVYQINVQDPDDSVKLTSDNLANKYDPSITLDGKYLYYIRKEQEQNGSLWQLIYKKDLNDPSNPDAILVQQFYNRKSIKISSAADECLFSSLGNSKIFLHNFSANSFIVIHDYVKLPDNANYMWSWNGNWIYFYNSTQITKIRAEDVRNLSTRKVVPEKVIDFIDANNDSITDIFINYVGNEYE